MIVTIHDSTTYYDYCRRAKAGEFTIYHLESGQSHKRKRKSKDGKPFLWRLHISEPTRE